MSTWAAVISVVEKNLRMSNTRRKESEHDSGCAFIRFNMVCMGDVYVWPIHTKKINHTIFIVVVVAVAVHWKCSFQSHVRIFPVAVS